MTEGTIIYLVIAFILLVIFVILQQMGRKQKRKARERRHRIIERLGDREED
jgi:preprotein translocase subunit YajC